MEESRGDKKFLFKKNLTLSKIIVIFLKKNIWLWERILMLKFVDTYYFNFKTILICKNGPNLKSFQISFKPGTFRQK